MSTFDSTAESTFGSVPNPPDEDAVSALLKPPALSYIQDLQQAIEKDPNFLVFHDRSIGLKVQSLLSRQGIYWDQEVFERQFPAIVVEAVMRLRRIEK